MQLPEGSILFIIVWGFVIFLLWNFYRFSQALRKITFVVLAGLASATLIGGIMYLHFREQRPLPAGRTSVLIFPFVEKSAGAPAGVISATGLALADMIAERLKQAKDSPFHLIPTGALFEIANRDSLIYIDYVLRFARLVKPAVVGFGAYQTTNSTTNHHSNWQAEFQIFDLRKISESSGQRLNLPPRFDNMQQLANTVARHIFQIRPNGEKITVAPIWQDHLEAELLQRYYSAHFILLTNQTEPILERARALIRTDSSRAAFANLYARAMLAHLRRRTANQKEWNDSLQMILPLTKRAAIKDSLNSESGRLLGEIYIRLKKWTAAERALVEARRREPADSRIYFLLAQLHGSRLPALGFKNELELYQQARALNPLNVEAALAAADYLWRENREKSAIEILENLLQLNPHHVEVLISLGRIYIGKNNEAKIFEIFERILKTAPNHAEAYYNLGIVYYQHKDFDNAIKFFERAIKLNDHVEARLYLAGIHQQRGNVGQALQYLRERIRLSHGDDDRYAAEARHQLYKILLARGEIPAHLRPDSLKK